MNFLHCTLVVTLLCLFVGEKVSQGTEVESRRLSELWTTFSSSYPKYNETTSLLHEMENLFPDLVHIYSVGKSVDGRELWVIHVTEQVNESRALLRPMVKIVANMHGDETLGRALMLMLATNLVQQYKLNDPR